jgi:hypothetical protein
VVVRPVVVRPVVVRPVVVRPVVVRPVVARRLGFLAGSAFPSDTGTLVSVPPRARPGERRVAALETAPAPAAIVATPPCTASAPSDAPALAALPPRRAPAPSADPTVRTAASAGCFTALGAFSCQRRIP